MRSRCWSARRRPKFRYRSKFSTRCRHRCRSAYLRILLERRPDVAAAERTMAEANAQIGIAYAAYYPNVTLSASGGFESSKFTSWFAWPSRFWSIGTSLSETIFDAGLASRDGSTVYRGVQRRRRRLSPDGAHRVPASRRLPRGGTHSLRANREAETSGRFGAAILRSRIRSLSDRHRSVYRRADRAKHAARRSANTGQPANAADDVRSSADHRARRRMGSVRFADACASHREASCQPTQRSTSSGDRDGQLLRSILWDGLQTIAKN